MICFTLYAICLLHLLAIENQWSTMRGRESQEKPGKIRTRHTIRLRWVKYWERFCDVGVSCSFHEVLE